jgi:hypothetical protein
MRLLPVFHLYMHGRESRYFVLPENLEAGELVRCGTDRVGHSLTRKCYIKIASPEDYMGGDRRARTCLHEPDHYSGSP